MYLAIWLIALFCVNCPNDSLAVSGLLCSFWFACSFCDIFCLCSLFLPGYLILMVHFELMFSSILLVRSRILCSTATVAHYVRC